MRNMFGWSLLALVSMVGIVSAQARVEPRPGARPAVPAPAAAPTAAAPAAAPQGTVDQQIAACLWGGNHNEVELAKFAEDRAKSDTVKDFAAQMIKDHSKSADKLARVAGNLVNAGTARGGGATETRREVRKVPADEEKEGKPEGRRDEGRKEAREDRREGREEAREDRRETREERSTTAAAPAGRHAFNWVTVHKEIGDQCLQSAKKELGGKEGQEFDQCYMGMQIVAHMGMIDKLKVFKNYATGELQQDIEESIDTAEHHLKEAKKIMDELKDKDSK